ncbi:MAG TPA: extracellular solute-binding protein [Gemmatimonadales bacterium]|nr:extracellular solute-binding protein [Gemmatimonadales bacterium]
MRLRRAVWGVVTACALASMPGSAAAQGTPGLAGDLVVFNAGSLGLAFRDLLKAFKAANPEVRTAQESAGSLESARKLTELGKIPDVIALADYAIFPKLLIPAQADWYATFATNALVLAYRDESAGAFQINNLNWYRILLGPGVRVGRSDPELDPAGYRTLMAWQLAERYYNQPTLATQLRNASPMKYVRPKEADLTALLQLGELDYIWTYASIARVNAFRMVRLPPEIDLSDPALATTYDQAVVTLPGATKAAGDSVQFRGEPIVYGLSIPRNAPHPEVAEAFLRFVFSPAGQRILASAGLTPMARPILGGPGQPPLSLRGLFSPSGSP